MLEYVFCLKMGCYASSFFYISILYDMRLEDKTFQICYFVLWLLIKAILDARNQHGKPQNPFFVCNIKFDILCRPTDKK